MATARSVLVVTAAREIGVLIQTQLEETGLYKVMVVDSDQEALLCIQTVAFTLAILDAELPGEKMIALATTMRHKLPKMRLVIICADTNPILPAVNAFQPAGLLNKPFNLPDLLDTLTKALQAKYGSGKPADSEVSKSPNPEAIRAFPPAPEWLHDASWAARNLTQLSLDTPAQAILIVRNGMLWADASKLPQPAAIELVEIINSAWEAFCKAPIPNSGANEQQDDLVRFINLDATKSEYILYATSLGKGMVLAVAFKTTTPFSTIRAKAGYLARELASPPGSAWQPLPHIAMQTSEFTSTNGERGDDGSPRYLPPLLEDVPPATPHKEGTFSETIGQAPTWFNEASAPSSISEVTTFPVGRTNATQVRETKLPISPEGTADRMTAPARSTQAGSEMTITPTGRLVAKSTRHDLTCCCTLLPRDPQHPPDGELDRLLREWVPQLCLAFGCQLLQLEISHEYLMVIARIAPGTAPGSFVRILRQQTSRRIFATFPDLATVHPAKEYWAPGYLLVSSSQRPPVPIIRQFIEQTRSQHGFS